MKVLKNNRHKLLATAFLCIIICHSTAFCADRLFQKKPAHRFLKARWKSRSHVQPAVNGYVFSCDEARRVACKEQYRLCDVFGCAVSTKGRPGGDGFAAARVARKTLVVLVANTSS